MKALTCRNAKIIISNVSMRLNSRAQWSALKLNASEVMSRKGDTRKDAGLEVDRRKVLRRMRPAEREDEPEARALPEHEEDDRLAEQVDRGWSASGGEEIAARGEALARTLTQRNLDGGEQWVSRAVLWRALRRRTTHFMIGRYGWRSSSTTKASCSRQYMAT